MDVRDLKEASLLVAEAVKGDVGRSLVRIDIRKMHQLGLETGDVVEIDGGKKTGALVIPGRSQDRGKSIIRMDGLLRRNVQTSIGENVSVRKANTQPADHIIVAPVEEGISLRAPGKVVRQALRGKPVAQDDLVNISGPIRREPMASSSGQGIDEFFSRFFGAAPIALGEIGLVVVSTKPKGIVIIGDQTSVEVMTEAPKHLQQVSRVTYEDIGGLDLEIQRVREMIELPMKHPELFQRLGIDPPKGVLLHGSPGTGKTLLAKAVANESGVNFVSLAGPEIMSKFYGECVSGDSLVFTNGGGLKSIEETIHYETVHSTIAFNFDSGNTCVLPIKKTFDKGTQETLRITAPHGNIEVTPSSRLLTLNEGKPIWVFADELDIGDQIAAPRKITIEKTEIPLILSFLNDNTLVGGSLVKTLFLRTSEYGKNKIMGQKIGVSAKKFKDLKYGIKKGRKALAKYVKRLFAFYPENNQEFLQLSENRKAPFYMTEELMYILGLLSGDGHLRHSSVMDSVTQIILTNKDSAVQKRYFKAIKNAFNVELRQFKKNDCSFYFTSSPIGNLLHNLGIPYSKKSANVKVPPYAITLPDQMLGSYLQGLFDADGGIQFTTKSKKKGRAIQITYYSKSKDLVMGIKLCLLRFGIVSTLRFRPRDSIWILTISDVDSIGKFREYISFTHESRLEKLRQESETAWTSPKYDRIPVARWIYEIGKEVQLTHRKLLQHGINPKVRGLTRHQLQKAYEMLSERGVDQTVLNMIQKLLNMKVIWTPIRKIETSQAHVYDFEVPMHHNFVANGLIVHNSEQRVRQIFEDAEKNAPSIIFIDEIDSIAPKREEVTGEVERRVVAQLLALMDGLKGRGKVIVIGATNRPNALDPALRRPGRFDREIEIGVPDKSARLEILMVHTRGMPLADKVDLLGLSERTHGFVGADVAALTREAAMHTLRRILPEIKFEEEALPPEILQKLIVTKDDFEEALKSIDPSAMREVLIEVPDVRWEDVGGLSEVQQKLIEMIDWPIRRPDVFDKHGVDPPRGILLFGPPGTGKTLLARAVANESEANFIAIRGPEVLSKWVGESERAIREIFRKAKQAAPCIVFLDEIDSIAPKRGGYEGGSHVTETVVNQLLSSLDGIENMAGVVVIAATNRPDMIDPALLRAGRFDRLILIPSSDEAARFEILNIHTRNMRLAPDIDLNQIASRMEGYVGADIENVCREAVMIALRRDMETDLITAKDIEEAMKTVHPSITPQAIEFYDQLEKRLHGRIIEKEADRDKTLYA